LAQFEDETDYRPGEHRHDGATQGRRIRSDGKKMFVMDANIAEKLIVAAKDGGSGVSLFLVDAGAPGQVAVT
jgi:alkylation response protein AidB-like acyl-CoA dehydrogenase